MCALTKLARQGALCLLGLVVAPLSASEGPIAHWTFDRLDGSTAPNVVTAGQSAIVDGATSAAGIEGGALVFDGRDDYVALGDFGENDAVTIAFWMKGQDVGRADDWQGLVTSDAWEEGVFHIGIRAGRIDVHLHLGESRRSRLRSRPLNNGTWYHVALVADRQGRMIRLILNGLEEDVADHGGELPKIKLLAQVAGREFDGNHFARHFHGTIDDVRFYDRALDEAEIQRLCPGRQSLLARDSRNIRTGFRIPDEGYCDQPYVVITKDGNWLCTLTTAGGHEGADNSHVVSTISADQGRTWSEIVELEPVDGPTSVYSLPVVAHNGRVYVFYDYNGDSFPCPGRSDCVGWFVYKYSDDHGRTWSKERYRLPMRMTAVDRTNTFQGKVQIFWGIGKPISVDDTMFFAFSKCGKYLIDRCEQRGHRVRCVERSSRNIPSGIAVRISRRRIRVRQREPADGEILFPIDKRTCGTDRRTAKMMAEDLAAARRKWLAESNGDRVKREKSDFLKYVDSQGRYADFHSNRHTFITNLSLAGVSPREAQELARHSDIRLTMGVYSHIGLQDKARAIGRLGDGGVSA
ncbi:MAG: tyrosine-type recombinase/integrase [Planctomycetes bacterium]|nr:tyrosine-type recombinase/integrase [Planctomycetota bacterium]